MTVARMACSCGLTLRPRPDALLRGLTIMACLHCDTPCQRHANECPYCIATTKNVRPQ